MEKFNLFERNSLWNWNEFVFEKKNYKFLVSSLQNDFWQFYQKPEEHYK